MAIRKWFFKFIDGQSLLTVNVGAKFGVLPGPGKFQSVVSLSHRYGEGLIGRHERAHVDTEQQGRFVQTLGKVRSK